MARLGGSRRTGVELIGPVVELKYVHIPKTAGRFRSPVRSVCRMGTTAVQARWGMGSGSPSRVTHTAGRTWRGTGNARGSSCRTQKGAGTQRRLPRSESLSCRVDVANGRTCTGGRLPHGSARRWILWVALSGCDRAQTCGSWVYYSGAGNTVFTIKRPVDPWNGTWTIEIETLRGAASASDGNTHYSRFRYVEPIDCFLWAFKTSSQVQALRVSPA